MVGGGVYDEAAPMCREMGKVRAEQQPPRKELIRTGRWLKANFEPTDEEGARPLPTKGESCRCCAQEPLLVDCHIKRSSIRTWSYSFGRY